MQVPLELSFHNLDSSDAVKEKVEERVKKLERFYKGMTSCRVAIEAPHKQHNKGNLFHVRIEMRVPGTELVVSRDPGDVNSHTDVYIAIRDAFNAAERQLEDFSRRQRGEVKAHDAPLQGKVIRLFTENGYGFIATTDGREIYFHQNAVVDVRFDSLEVGTPVELVAVHGESPQGPQASTVRPISRLQLQS